MYCLVWCIVIYWWLIVWLWYPDHNCSTSVSSFGRISSFLIPKSSDTIQVSLRRGTGFFLRGVESFVKILVVKNCCLYQIDHLVQQKLLRFWKIQEVFSAGTGYCCSFSVLSPGAKKRKWLLEIPEKKERAKWKFYSGWWTSGRPHVPNFFEPLWEGREMNFRRVKMSSENEKITNVWYCVHLLIVSNSVMTHTL